MKKPRVQQRTERRISAALRLVMVAVLLLAQIALVIVLSDLLKQRMALAYTVLQLLAGVVAMRIWSRPGATSYKMGWIILVLFVPVVGLILYLLWNGDRPSKRLSLKKPVPIEEPLAQQELARTNLEKLRQTAPQWYPLAAYLSGKGFDLYRNTALRYLPTGEAYLEDMLTTLDTAQRFIFLEYFIMAEGEIWDRLSDILCRKSRQGVEVKLIFDDFGSMMRMPNEKVEELCGQFPETYPVNYNCPGQVSVACAKEQLAPFSAAVKAAGGRALPLKVRGGFHSPFMASAAEGFAQVLADCQVEEPKIPLYSNRTGAVYSGDAKALLAQQIASPVRWEAIVRDMIAAGVDTFIELGPGSTLCGLIQKIDKTVKTYPLATKEDLEKVVQEVKA